MSIKKRSSKRAAQERLYTKRRKSYLLEHPTCEVLDCTDEATQIHHKKGRIGELLCNTDFFLSVCAHCHLFIERHPDEAKVLGYSLSRLSV